MFGKHVVEKLSAYCQGELSPEESRRVAEHVLTCTRCHRELEDVKLGIKLAKQLPQATAPASLWSEIENALALEQTQSETARAAHLHLEKSEADDSRSKHSRQQSSQPSTLLSHFSFTWPRVLAFSALLLFAVGASAVWYYARVSGRAWQVARLGGSPEIDSKRIGDTDSLAVGEWLVTDGISRALIKVGLIGNVEIDPNTRVRLVETSATEHRLELARGRLHARIWAPPRLFFVDTPSAEAIDLGCAYTLEVDDAGNGLLKVTSGYVALDAKGRTSVVPMGAACATRKGTGPGTPFFEDSTESFRAALNRFDFEATDVESRSQALQTVLTQARKRDGLTLWNLLSRVEGTGRERVYERLAELVPPPQEVTREGVLRLDELMLDQWKEVMRPDWFKQN
ncbi:MAG: zf-HC2 domain-containing protein [Pyrinomonadaceae bacterium]